MSIPPIERRFVVALSPPDAFDVFAREIRIWWPRAFTSSGEELRSVEIEPFPKGRVFETNLAGEQTDWGTVATYQPGELLALNWFLATSSATVVTVRFEPAAAGTQVSFSHHGWQDGQETERAKFDADQGWNQVLGHFRGLIEWNEEKKAAETTEQVIAQRTLRIMETSGERTVEIRVYAPQPAGSASGCRYEIDWPNGTRKMTMFGFDGVQALVHALQMIGTELYSSPYHEAGTLVLDKPGAGYGFPVPLSERSSLQGHDAEFL